MDDFSETKNDFSMDENEFNLERKPQNEGYDTFSLRTNPEELLTKFELQLRNKYLKKHKDGKVTQEQITGTQPLCSEEGIQEILFMLKGIVNNHTVQGNQTNITEHRLRMREIADSVTIFFYAHSRGWGLEDIRINSLIDNIYFLMDLFLSRTIENKERELYGETFKETTNRDLKQDRSRGGFISGTLNKILAR